MKRVLLPLVAVLALANATTAGAENLLDRLLGKEEPPTRSAVRKPPSRSVIKTPDRMPLWDVLKTIDRRVPGRALDAREVDAQGEPAYRIKWIAANGQVHEIIANARSGEILK